MDEKDDDDTMFYVNLEEGYSEKELEEDTQTLSDQQPHTGTSFSFPDEKKPSILISLLDKISSFGIKSHESIPQKSSKHTSHTKVPKIIQGDEDESFPSSELPVYTAKFCLTFSGTQNELADNHVCVFPMDMLKKHFHPDIPDPHSPQRFWGDTANFDTINSTDVIFLGASVRGYDNRLPFSCCLKCDTIPAWNALMFNDGNKFAMRLPSCSQSQSQFILGDRRECTRGDFWRQLVVSYVEHMINTKIVKKISKRKNGEREEEEIEDKCLVKIDSELYKEINSERDSTSTSTSTLDSKCALLPVETLSEGCHIIVKRNIGYCTLEDLKKGLSFSLYPDSKMEWERTEEETTLNFEVGVNLEIYFSCT